LTLAGAARDQSSPALACDDAPPLAAVSSRLETDGPLWRDGRVELEPELIFAPPLVAVSNRLETAGPLWRDGRAEQELSSGSRAINLTAMFFLGDRLKKVSIEGRKNNALWYR